MADNLTLGRGELWFDRFDDVTKRGERYIGNTPAFSLSVEIDTLEHYSSDRGFKDKDESVTRSMNWNGSFTTDNIDVDNMAYFFAGKARNLTIAPLTGATDVLTRIVKGLTYQIGSSATNPSGIRKITSATLVKGASTSLTEGEDYSIDLEMGRVTFLPGGSKIAGANDTVTITYTSPSQTRNQVISGREPVSGALRYISMNPVGEKVDFFMPNVKINPSGEFTLKGDEWQQLTFDVEVLRKGDFEAIYRDGRPV